MKLTRAQTNMLVRAEQVLIRVPPIYKKRKRRIFDRLCDLGLIEEYMRSAKHLQKIAGTRQYQHVTVKQRSGMYTASEGGRHVLELLRIKGTIPRPKPIPTQVEPNPDLKWR